MWQSYHQLLNINDLKNSGNDRNEIEVSVKIPVPARFRARDRKEFLRNFEPRSEGTERNILKPREAKGEYQAQSRSEVSRSQKKHTALQGCVRLTTQSY
jgi:hypothetical protein